MQCTAMSCKSHDAAKSEVLCILAWQWHPEPCLRRPSWAHFLLLPIGCSHPSCKLRAHPTRRTRGTKTSMVWTTKNFGVSTLVSCSHPVIQLVQFDQWSQAKLGCRQEVYQSARYKHDCHQRWEVQEAVCFMLMDFVSKRNQEESTWFHAIQLQRKSDMFTITIIVLQSKLTTPEDNLLMCRLSTIAWTLSSICAVACIPHK